jgi:hypothetical protein
VFGKRYVAGLLCALGITIAIQAMLRDAAVPPATGSAEERLDISEAVVRHVFVINYNAPAYYLSLFRQDPPAGFLARFKEQNPILLPLSARGQRGGTVLSVESVKYLSDTKVEVWTSIGANGMAHGTCFLVESGNGEWVVTGAVGYWTT